MQDLETLVNTRRYFRIDDGGAETWLVATDPAHAARLVEGVEFGDPAKPLSEATDEDGRPLRVVEVTAERASRVMCHTDNGVRPLLECDLGDWFCSEW